MKAVYKEVDYFGVGVKDNDPSFEITFSIDNNLNILKVVKFVALDQSSLFVPIEELIQAVERAIQNRKNHNGAALIDELQPTDDEPQKIKNCLKVALPVQEGLDFVDVNEIVRSEANRSYANFYLTNGTKILVSKPLSEFATLLAGCGFLRVHRSHMVNLKHVKKYIKAKKSYLVMADNSRVEVSPSKKKVLYKAIGWL
ncbi:LytTR family DNA-binding domain-containing protein [Fulvivirgaceae bacterium BMA10]|uniref:LytTR family DNA-binding domain-containing protein n=1 Tax=Splendidivirga corallicola TaxID=3051826 RepID=A0ABT8KX09_9BACT|nr:LytTR family DNA-binding domain-containing protein [Fulvivirgaceae bacterium BMA10]